MEQLEYQTYSFQIISILMLIYFIYHWHNQPLYRSLLLWSTLVIATPIPNASILLSFPAKVFFDIHIHKSQIAASILSILFIMILPGLAQPSFLKKILRQRNYLVFVISIFSSILLASMIDDILETRMTSLTNIIIASLCLIVYYLLIQ